MRGGVGCLLIIAAGFLLVVGGYFAIVYATGGIT